MWRITQRILEISADRFQRQEAKGGARWCGTAWMCSNAQVDLQADSTTFILASQRRELRARELNVLLGRQPDEVVLVSRSMDYAQGLSEEQLVSGGHEGQRATALGDGAGACRQKWINALPVPCAGHGWT